MLRGIHQGNFEQYEQERAVNSSVIGKMTVTDNWLYRASLRDPLLLSLRGITRIEQRYHTNIHGYQYYCVEFRKGDDKRRELRCDSPYELYHLTAALELRCPEAAVDRFDKKPGAFELQQISKAAREFGQGR